jgi:hypothetical protein
VRGRIDIGVEIAGASTVQTVNPNVLMVAAADFAREACGATVRGVVVAARAWSGVPPQNFLIMKQELEKPSSLERGIYEQQHSAHLATAHHDSTTPKVPVGRGLLPDHAPVYVPATRWNRFSRGHEGVDLVLRHRHT